jgi:hypothetical protein
MQAMFSSALGKGRRIALMAACAASLSVGVAAFGDVPRASASNVIFCEFVLLAKETGCAEGSWRLLTRVNAKSINAPLCAGAHNSNGVEIGGWTCSGEGGETSNGNYNGTLYLKGMVYNPSPAQYTGHGQEWFN